MSYETYEEFSDNLGDILSSGNGITLLTFHEETITDLVSGMDRDSVVEFLNIFYSDQDPSELLEGELGMIAGIVSNLDPKRDDVTADFQIVFK